MNLDFEGLAAALLSRAGELLPAWLPGGKVRGREYVCGCLRGGPGESMSVNMSTGKWADFADSDLRGGDLTSLYAAIEGISQGEAAKRLAERVGFGLTPEPVKAPAPVKEHILVPPPAGVDVPSFLHTVHGKPVATWRYTDPKGATLFYVARYEQKDGKKTFLPWSWSAEGYWVQKGWPAPRPLYGMVDLAARPDAPVLVVEGEKAADAARKVAGHVYTVVTWPNGSQAASKVDWRPLAGRKVLIWPDADEPGNKAAKTIAGGLAKVCPEVKVLDVAGQPDGWDAADAVAEGWDWAKVVAWAKPRAKVFQPAGDLVAQATAVAKAPGATAAAQVNVTVQTEEPGDAEPSLYALYESLGLALTGQGAPICNVDNALRVLERHDDFKNFIWFDEFHQRYFTTWKSDRPKEWGDVDTLNLTAFMQRDLGLRKMSKEMVHDAAVIYAHQRVTNEPKDWMSTLGWDGTDRCEHFFVDCFGAEDTDYIRAAGRNFWVGLAARIYSPGCILRNVVVLEGPQLAGKSTALSLVGGKWYAESAESVTSKDFFLSLQGKLIVEIAELDSFGRAEVTRIKQVISCRTDRYRSPYERSAADHPRQCVFVGTTNESTYLRDNTGGTRFWPVKCGEINKDAIVSMRDQLFAEAVARFKRGEDWYQMPDSAAEEQEKRRQADEWEGIIRDFLIQRDEVEIREIAADCLKIEVAKLDTGVAMRIARNLRTLDWDKKHTWNGGHQKKVWFRKKEKEMF